MPDGINTIIGEKGIDLSGGQKQRVVISRAFLNQSNIVIFDTISRYAELTGKSNALLVKESRINTLRNRQNDNLSKTYEDKKKEMLMSLKEEIDKENYSFLQKNENDLLDNKMVMKAA